MGIKLDRENSIEFFLFDTFARFLGKIEKYADRKKELSKLLIAQKINPTNEFIFYCYVGTELLNNYGARSVEAFYSAPDRAISDERIIFFCKKFKKVYATLKASDKLSYEAMNLAFLKWKSDIYLKNEVEDTDEDENMPKSMFNNENSPSDINTTITNQNLSNIIQAISDYYQSNIFPNEQEALKLLELSLNKRQKAKLKLADKETVEFVSDSINHYFTSGSVELYEISNDKVINKSLKFKMNLPHEDGFYCWIESGQMSNNISISGCVYDIFQNLMTIVSLTHASDHANIVDFISFPVSNDNNHIGYRITYRPSNYKIDINTVLIKVSKFQQNTVEHFYNEYDISSEKVSDFVKSTLKFTHEMYKERKILEDLPVIISQVINYRSDVLLKKMYYDKMMKH